MLPISTSLLWITGLGLILPTLRVQDTPPTKPLAAAASNGARELVAGGEVHTFPYNQIWDGAPLPLTAARSAGDQGDQWLAPAAGDPRFLSFAAGAYQPSAGERIDPALLGPDLFLAQDGRARSETYAFVMFHSRITEERIRELESFGARVLGFHPHYALRIALTKASVARIAGLPYVSWIGPARPWQKLHPLLSEAMLGMSDEKEISLIVSTFERDGGEPTRERAASAAGAEPEGRETYAPESEAARRVLRSNGWQEQRLRELGFDVRGYEPNIAAFRGRMLRADVERLAAADFVQFLELDLPFFPMHDESMPLIQADLTRASWTGGTNDAAVAGIVDSGFDHSHFDLNHTYAAAWDYTPEGNPWFDGLGHGSHVAGTICGNGDVIAGHRGGAPELGWGATGRIFVLKVFDQNENWAPGLSTSDILDRTHSSYTDGNGFLTPRPHVINHSYGSGSGAFLGSEATARALDDDIHAYDQLHVFAAGNDGPGESTLSVQASAKNVFTVGNVIDYRGDTTGYPGSIWSGSSRGPTGDDRWKPNVVAPGRLITSVAAETTNLYSEKSGTSMAAPHVAALAVQLCDRYEFLRYRPYTLGAVLMAAALTKDDEVLTVPSSDADHHLNNYGAGRVDAQRSIGSDSQQALYFWAFTQNTVDYSQVELTVGPGATRLTVVMYYHEEAASAGAGSALVNDLDMWIDRAPFSNGGASGEYFAHQSPRDNVELRMIENPLAEDYRIKVVPENATSSSRVGLCAIVSYGDTSPAVSIDVSAPELYVQPDDAVELVASVSNSEHVASAIHLQTSLYGIPFGDSPESAVVSLLDGIDAELADNTSDGEEVTLGNIAHGRTRTVTWTKRWSTEGIKDFEVEVHGDNISNNGAADAVQITVDGTAPSGPTDLDSSSHELNTADCEADVQVGWTAASDALAGLEGYSYVWTAFAGTIPNTSIDLGAGVTELVSPLQTGTWYFHIRAVDRSGNWGDAVHYGPIVVQEPESYTYCVATPNSTGLPAAIWFEGSLSLAANNLVLRTSDLPPNKPCNYFYGPTEVQLPFGNGFRCVGGQLKRFAIVNTGGGELIFPVDNTNLPVGGDFVVGQALKFQCWYRDPSGGGAFHNLSNGLSLQFCP